MAGYRAGNVLGYSSWWANVGPTFPGEMLQCWTDIGGFVDSMLDQHFQSLLVFSHQTEIKLEMLDQHLQRMRNPWLDVGL